MLNDGCRDGQHSPVRCQGAASPGRRVLQHLALADPRLHLPAVRHCEVPDPPRHRRPAERAGGVLGGRLPSARHRARGFRSPPTRPPRKGGRLTEDAGSVRVRLAGVGRRGFAVLRSVVDRLVDGGPEVGRPRQRRVAHMPPGSASTAMSPVPAGGRRPDHPGARCRPRRGSSHTRRRSAWSWRPTGRSCRRPSGSSTLRPRIRDCGRQRSSGTLHRPQRDSIVR
jgi:hypothetical protein